LQIERAKLCRRGERIAVEAIEPPMSVPSVMSAAN
jgi:hypothetical protein